MKRCVRWIMLIATLLGGAAVAAAQPPTTGYSTVALYNRANAFARAGKPGLAVLNYERASLLAPNDPDVEANLLFVRRSLGLQSPPKGWLYRTVGAANPALAAWIGVIGCAMLALGLLAGRRYARARWAARGAAFGGLALIAGTVAHGVMIWPKLHEAIIIAASAPVHVSPAPLGETLFSLKEAEAVRIVGEHEGFILVRTLAGRAGWVWHADLAPVVPEN